MSDPFSRRMSPGSLPRKGMCLEKVIRIPTRTTNPPKIIRNLPSTLMMLIQKRVD